MAALTGRAILKRKLGKGNPQIQIASKKAVMASVACSMHLLMPVKDSSYAVS